jgi:uncharacterized protein (TIGR02246 family)
LRAVAAFLLCAAGAAHAGEVTVIRPSSFIGAEGTYYLALDGRALRDLETRQHVRIDVPNGRHVLAVRCPKPLALEYHETRVEEQFGSSPAFFVVEPKYNCVTLQRVDPRTAASLISNTRLSTSTGTTYREGKVEATAPLGGEAEAVAEAPGMVPPAAAPAVRSADPAAAEEISALTAAWVDAFNSRDPARIVALYDPQAVLIGAAAKKPALGATAIAAYFAHATQQPMDRIALGEHTTRAYGDVAIDSGLYNFFQVQDGKATVIPERYTLVYRKRDGKWLIVEHHSSRVP